MITIIVITKSLLRYSLTESQQHLLIQVESPSFSDTTCHPPMAFSHWQMGHKVKCEPFWWLHYTNDYGKL